VAKGGVERCPAHDLDNGVLALGRVRAGGSVVVCAGLDGMGTGMAVVRLA
jgi:hypothetical protein